jgi:hypothetical protein
LTRFEDPHSNGGDDEWWIAAKKCEKIRKIFRRSVGYAAINHRRAETVMLITALVLIITESVWCEGASTPTRFASRRRCGVRRDARDRATYSWMLDLIYGRSRGRRSRYDRFAGLRLIVLGEPSRDLPLLPTDLATHLIIIQSGIIIKHTVDIVADHLCRDETAHFFSYLRFVEKNVVGKIRKREIAGRTRTIFNFP